MRELAFLPGSASIGATPTPASAPAPPHAGLGNQAMLRLQHRANQAALRQAHATVASPATPLPSTMRHGLEQRFEHDFGAVTVHADPRAAASARALGARAYAVGSHLVFDAGQFAPHTAAGAALLAHELAHVVAHDRQGARAVPASPEQWTISQPDDAGEQYARQLTGGARRSRPPATSATVHCQRRGEPLSVNTPATFVRRSDPNAVIPIADYIRYVVAVETAYPRDTPEQILTRIRQVYYSSDTLAGADQLIPDSPMVESVVEWVPRGDRDIRATVERRRTVRASDVGGDTYRHLSAHADENAIGDNPSPYIVLPGGERIDVGHLLLSLDALIHARSGWPYADYGVPNIDPAGWVADLGFASMWMSHHQRGGAAPGGAPVRPATPDLAAYFRASAPTEDLLGDADAFGMHAAWTGSARLSQVMQAYFLGAGGVAPGVQTRWQVFCARNGLTYTRSGNSITWDPSIYTTWVPRIDRAIDLFNGGAIGALSSAFSTPAPGTWPNTRPVLDMFLSWLRPRLERELAAG